MCGVTGLAIWAATAAGPGHGDGVCSQAEVSLVLNLNRRQVRVGSHVGSADGVGRLRIRLGTARTGFVSRCGGLVSACGGRCQLLRSLRQHHWSCLSAAVAERSGHGVNPS